jgi:hypothetical protein
MTAEKSAKKSNLSKADPIFLIIQCGCTKNLQQLRSTCLKFPQNVFYYFVYLDFDYWLKSKI